MVASTCTWPILNCICSNSWISILAGTSRKPIGNTGVFHLTGENGAQPMARALKADDAEPILLLVDRLEEGQPLDVVPMRVGQQQGELQGMRIEFL